METPLAGCTATGPDPGAVTISPQDYDAVLFDLDGVLTKTAIVHAAAWKKLFDGFLEQRAAQAGEPFVPFDIETDYLRYVDGKPRHDGVADFLASRGIRLPPGSPGIEQVAPERVRVGGARGRAPTDSYKVSATQFDGYRCAGSTVIIDIDAAAKAQRMGDSVIARTRAIFKSLGLPDYTSVKVALLGADALYGPHARTQASREVMVRISVTHPMKQALEIFAHEIAPSGTSWAPGTTGPSTGRPGPSPNIKPLSLAHQKDRGAGERGDR